MEDAVEPQIRLLLMEFPEIPSAVTAELTAGQAKTFIYQRIAELPPVYRPVDPCAADPVSVQ